MKNNNQSTTNSLNSRYYEPSYDGKEQKAFLDFF